MTTYYVYAVLPIKSNVPDDLRGIRDEPLRAIPCGELQAIVGEHEAPEPKVSPERVLAHHDVVARLRQGSQALPVQFGTVFSSVSAVQESLEERSEALADTMSRLAGTSEFGISVLWDSKQAAPNSELNEAPVSGVEYMRQRLGEYQRQNDLRAKAEQVSEAIERSLGPYSRDWRLSVLPTDNMPVRGSFLVAEREMDTFRREFTQLCADLSDLRFSLVGPWPPYSFVSSRSGSVEGTLGAKMSGNQA
jgi:hypothetical protein